MNVPAKHIKFALVVMLTRKGRDYLWKQLAPEEGLGRIMCRTPDYGVAFCEPEDRNRMMLWRAEADAIGKLRQFCDANNLEPFYVRGNTYHLTSRLIQPNEAQSVLDAVREDLPDFPDPPTQYGESMISKNLQEMWKITTMREHSR